LDLLRFDRIGCPRPDSPDSDLDGLERTDLNEKLQQLLTSIKKLKPQQLLLAGTEELDRVLLSYALRNVSEIS
jgi:hypothetical protein